MEIAILGSGNVGGTLGRRWSELGHSVVWGVRDPSSAKAQAAAAAGRVMSIAEAAAASEVVVLAVPWAAVEEVLSAAGDLSGKLLIDCTNAVGGGYRPAVEGADSAAAFVAQHAPGARVVKAFNTLGAGMMADLELGATRAAGLICGDDQAAKQVVGGLAEQLGFEVIDVGPLAAAPLLESAALLWITLAYRQGQGPDFAFGLLRRSR